MFQCTFESQLWIASVSHFGCPSSSRIANQVILSAALDRIDAFVSEALSSFCSVPVHSRAKFLDYGPRMGVVSVTSSMPLRMISQITWLVGSWYEPYRCKTIEHVRIAR
jgi:hypothetical protein